MSFLGEIKRRRVFQVAVVYAVVAWGLIEVVATVEEPLGLPDWVDTFVIVLVIVGFPLALILSWAFDLTPAGVVRTSSTDDEEIPAASDKTASVARVPPAPELLKNSVAVLPLDNLSPNPDDAYFAAGIHEEILNYVAKIKDINVIARTSVKRYADTDIPITEIAAELGVGTIMEGSVRYAGERVRVTAQLIDAATENHLWSEVYERDLADIFAIQADIAEKIADALAAELSAAEKENIEKLPTSSPEAYALYLRAMTIIQEHGHSASSAPELRVTTKSYLDQAIDFDPEFALAYAQRAHLSASLLNQDPGTLGDYNERLTELESLAIDDLEKALALDSSIGAAHGALARIHQFNWRKEEAYAAHTRALDLAPNNAEVLMDYAVFCSLIGKHEVAIERAKRAIALNPNNAPAHMWWAMINLRSSDVATALDAERRAAALAPTFGLAHVLLGHLEHMQGDNEEAVRQLRIAEELLRNDMNPTFLGEMVGAYARAGQPEDAARIFQRIENAAETHRIPAIAWIVSYLGLGDDEQVYRWLTVAADSPEPYIGYFSLMNAQSNIYRYPLLDEPRYREVREKIGFRD